MRFGVLACVVAMMMPLPAVAIDVTGVHFAPTENLERIDTELLSQARRSIDLAAYVLTDRPVIDALIAARQRGVIVRVLLDPQQRHDHSRLSALADTIRVKRPGPIMHLKSYVIDDVELRTGSANFTASGLKKQDNDLVISRDIAAVGRFNGNFLRAWEIAMPYRSPPGTPPSMNAPVPSPPIEGWTELPMSEPPPPTERPSTAKPPTPTVAATTDAGGEDVACSIKGNVNRSGERIYYLPGQSNYDRITMDGSRGKRWFCDEAQALAAGWRRALR